MWVALAFLSATLLGCYDFFKKVSLKDNSVVGVLLLNTLFSVLFFAPIIILSRTGYIEGGALFVRELSLQEHFLLQVKAIIVLLSWMFGYVGLKHLPITIVAPIQAMRPVIVLIGAVLFLGEGLNVYQWIGVVIAIISVFHIARTKDGVYRVSARWVVFVLLSALFGAISALYDKYLMNSIEPIAVQSWFNVYQCIIMCMLVANIKTFLPKYSGGALHWRFSILMIPLFLGMADYCYYSALAQEGAFISVVSMIRRGSVVVSFLFGALLLHEKNIKTKAVDVVLVLIGLLFLYLGSK